MKKYLFLLLFPLSLFAADNIVIASQCNVYVNGANFGSMEDSIANNPSKAQAIKDAWKAQVESDVTAKLAEVASLGKSGDEGIAKKINVDQCQSLIDRADASGCAIKQSIKDSVASAK